jgi:hypothetical protein
VAKTTSFLTFYIVLTDAARVAALQAQYPKGVNRAPYDAGPPEGGAAIEFAAPLTSWTLQPGGPPPPAAPYIWSPWSPLTTAANDHPFPVNVAKFTRHTGGFFGLGGTTITYYWIGQFVYAGTAADPPGDVNPPTDAPAWEKAPIPTRRFIEGFEQIHAGVGAPTGGAVGAHVCRAAARHVGGFGYALREGNNSAASVTLNTLPGGPGAAQATNWTRGRLRLRGIPTAAIDFYRERQVNAPAAGFALGVDATGRLCAWNISSSSVLTNLGSFGDALPVWDGLSTSHAWRALDVLSDYNTDNTNARLRVFLNRELVATFDVPTADGGFGANTDKCNTVNFGTSFSQANTLEIDLDDFINADQPAGMTYKGLNAAQATRPYNSDQAGVVVGNYQTGDLIHRVYTDPTTAKKSLHVYKCIASGPTQFPTPTTGGSSWHRYEGLDWLNGSKVVLARPKAFSVNQGAGWTGQARTCGQQGFALTSAVVATITGATSGSVLEIDTDVDTMARSEPGSLGAVALQLTCASARGATAASGSLGYNANAAGLVSLVVTETAVVTSRNMVGHLAGATDPIDLTSLQLRYTKAANADAATIKMLTAQVELIGQFWSEDYAPLLSTDVAPTDPVWVGQHNAPYPRSPWAVGGLAGPMSPVTFIGGTYVGNATATDLTFREPIHFIWIRPLTGGAGGYHWMSPYIGGHLVGHGGVDPFFVDEREDLTFVPAAGADAQQQRYIYKITGAHAQINANAVTYQYIAVSDPGGRFVLNGTFAHDANAPSPKTNPLINPTFLPGWVFLMAEDANGGSTASKLYYQGPGTPADAVILLAGSAYVNAAMTAALGALTTKAAFHSLMTAGCCYACWRRADGNNDPGQPGVVAFATWTGDAAASRTVSLSPASGKRPLWALVLGDNSSGSMRDPSHTSTNSTNLAGTDTTTGITGGGIDSFSVGSTLNANGVVYNALVFFASATACNNGWGCNGEYAPVEPAPPADGPWPPDPDPIDYLPPPEPEPPPAPDDEPDLAPACVAATQKVVNAALSRIGVSVQITALATEVTQEAITARLHIKDDVETVLKAIPWQRAKRRTNLVLVGGTSTTPVNNDWQYSYRAPIDMIRALRIASQTGLKRHYDPTRIAFEVGSDNTGDLIYTDADLTTGVVQLEYTARPTCPAASLGAEFREALMWKHAASLAPALSKDPGKAAYCDGQYRDALVRFNVKDANEQAPQKPDDGDPDFIRGR